MRLLCLSLGALSRNKNESGNLCGAGVGGAALGWDLLAVSHMRLWPSKLRSLQSGRRFVWAKGRHWLQTECCRAGCSA